MTTRLLALTLFWPVLASSALAQESPPIIDMHLHGPLSGESIQPIQPWLETLERFNVQKVVLAAFPDHLAAWLPEAPDRLIPSLTFPCLPRIDTNCPDGVNLPDLEWLQGELQLGRIQVLGEVLTQLFGISPADPLLEPYFALAEEFDIPFGLHMGPGPLWAVSTRSIYVDFPDFRIAAGNPLELEEVLRRHPSLRLFIMHAGWPMLDEMLSILWHHPNVYVGLGGLQIAISRTEYYVYLRRMIDAGFGHRVMFGSDVALDMYGEGIQAILDAEFLTEEQKRNILYNNAARFLRLSAEEIARHHGR